MTQVAFRPFGLSEKPRYGNGRSFGCGSICDAFLAEALNVSVENVTAFVLGGHGDTMGATASLFDLCRIPITELLPADQIEPL
jgi:malate dehydrogenase